jgi:hypothetical protein
MAVVFLIPTVTMTDLKNGIAVKIQSKFEPVYGIAGALR